MCFRSWAFFAPSLILVQINLVSLWEKCSLRCFLVKSDLPSLMMSVTSGLHLGVNLQSSVLDLVKCYEAVFLNHRNHFLFCHIFSLWLKIPRAGVLRQKWKKWFSCPTNYGPEVCLLSLIAGSWSLVDIQVLIELVATSGCYQSTEWQKSAVISPIHIICRPPHLLTSTSFLIKGNTVTALAECDAVQ